MPADISFEISPADSELVDQIVTRGRAIDRAQGHDTTRTHAVMDVIATHANGTPLRLADWLAADDFNLAHDWFGIRNCLDRSTGQLTRHFLPRFAVPEVAEAA